MPSITNFLVENILIVSANKKPGGALYEDNCFKNAPFPGKYTEKSFQNQLIHMRI